jgi:hypothetical protein
LSARSDDGGQSFAGARVIPGSDAAGNRGWESTAADAVGRVLTMWLDHRELAESERATAATQHDGHAHTGHGDASGVERAQRSKLYFARLDEPGAHAITGGVCYCCKTSLASGADGAIYAAWRHVYDGNVRDIAFTMSRDGGRSFAPPVRVSEDQWALDGCPENGPALGVDGLNRVHVVWPTLVTAPATAGEPRMALFYASTRNGGEFSARQEIPTHGTPRHPQLALGTDGALLVVWDEQVGGTRRVVLSRAELTGNALHVVRLEELSASRSEYPVVVGLADGAFVTAWTSGRALQSVIRVERIAPP